MKYVSRNSINGFRSISPSIFTLTVRDVEFIKSENSEWVPALSGPAFNILYLMGCLKHLSFSDAAAKASWLVIFQQSK